MLKERVAFKNSENSGSIKKKNYAAILINYWKDLNNNGHRVQNAMNKYIPYRELNTNTPRAIVPSEVKAYKKSTWTLSILNIITIPSYNHSYHKQIWKNFQCHISTKSFKLMYSFMCQRISHSCWGMRIKIISYRYEEIINNVHLMHQSTIAKPTVPYSPILQTILPFILLNNLMYPEVFQINVVGLIQLSS